MPEQKREAEDRKENTKGYVFGDSFVKIFNLCKNRGMSVYKYKGATMKGLTNPSNRNRKHIE